MSKGSGKTPGETPIEMYILVKKIAVYVLLALINFYRYVISPVTGSNCRYHPSCSSFAQQAIREHGPFSGSKLALLRILRCRPGMPGGYDPVPRSNIKNISDVEDRENPGTLSNPESAQ